MATLIKTLKSGGNTILPRTVVGAVFMEDGSTLEYALQNRDTEDVKITEELAAELDMPLGTTLSDVILSLVANNPEVVEATVE